MTRVSVPSAAMLALQGRMKLNPVEVRQRVAALRAAIERAKSGRARTEQWVFIRDVALISESLMAAGVWRSTQDDRDAIVTPWLHVLIAAGERAQRDDHSPLGEGDGGVLDGLMDWYQSLLTEASIQQLHWARRSAAQLIHDGVEELRAAGNSVAGYSVSAELARLVADIIRERTRQGIAL